jgi:hypothetical protein
MKEAGEFYAAAYGIKHMNRRTLKNKEVITLALEL